MASRKDTQNNVRLLHYVGASEERIRMTRPLIAVALAVIVTLLAASTMSAAPADTVTVAQAQLGVPHIFKPPVTLLRPTEWASLRLWPARYVESFAGGTTNPAVAAYAGKLLLVEVYQGALYLSQLEPDSLKVIGKRTLSGLQSGRTVKDVDAVVVKGVLWVTWISQAASKSRQMFLQHNLQTAVSASPVEEHLAIGCSLAVFSDQLWVLWRSPGPSGGLCLARYDAASGLGQPQQWPIQRAERVGGAVDLGGELFLAGIKTAPVMKLPAPIKPPALVGGQRTSVIRPQVKPQPARSVHQLWAAKFNGQRFYGSQMLRGHGNFSHPACAMLDGQVITVYASGLPADSGATLQSSIDITVIMGEGGEVTSTSYDSGGHNVAPDVVGIGEALFVAYNKWSANPDSAADAVNRGTYVGKIELKF